MLSSATKTNKNVNAVPLKTAHTTFFRKAGEQSFFNSKENNSFFGKPVQARLTVSTPDDPHEKEADAVADKVMRMPEPVSIAASPIPAKEEKLERKEEEEVQAKQETPVINKVYCKEDNEEKLHAKSESILFRNEEKHLDTKQYETSDNTKVNNKNISLHRSDIIQQSGRSPPTTSIPFEQTLASTKGGGSALPDNTRNFMESRFNADFSGVRIHTDSNAQQLSSSVNSKAFAHGNDIYFNKDQFSPHSNAGGTLLAHELTHTIQQGAVAKANISSKNLSKTVSIKSAKNNFADNTIFPQSIGQGQGRAPPSLTGVCPTNVTFSTGNQSVHVPLCGIANVTASTAPPNIPGINWALTPGTTSIAAGTSISNAGDITFGSGQTGGTLRVTADQPAASGGGTCSRFTDLRLNSHPAVINSTFVVGPPATNASQLYGAVFDHNFSSADGNISSIENVGVGEQFSGIPNPTGTTHVIPGTPFGSFTLQTANLTDGATNNWFLRSGSLGGTHDSVTIGRAGINVGNFLQSASNRTPVNSLPAAFTITQGLHWFCRQAAPGSRWTSFANVDHIRTLRLSGTAVEFAVSVNGQENVDIYTGHPAIIKAQATPVSIPITPPTRRGVPSPPPNTSTITADSRPDPLPGGHSLRFSIQGAALGCIINNRTGVLRSGNQTGSVRVRVRDSVTANPNFDEVVVTIMPPPSPTTPASPGTQQSGSPQPSNATPVPTIQPKPLTTIRQFQNDVSTNLVSFEQTSTTFNADEAVFKSTKNNTLYRSPVSSVQNQISFANIDLSGKSGGSALPDGAKEYFRHSFKADTSDIRVHTDDEATEICRSRKAPAFTQGRHICFDPSKYSPGSEEGGKLLAKQVSASLAQRSITVNKIQGKAPVPAKQTAIKIAPKGKKKTGPKGKGDKKKKAGGKPKGKHKGDKSDGPAVKSVKPNPKKSPSHPDEDPAFQKVVGKTKETAKSHKAHDPAESKATDAQKASPAAPKEAESKAKERKTDGIDEAAKEDKPFDAKTFKEELLKKIEDVTPKTLEDATEFKENNKIGEVKNVMGNKVSGEKQDTTGTVAKATAQPAQVNDTDNKHPLPLPPTPKGPKPAGISAPDAAPKPKLDNEISLQDKSKSLDDEMKANNVTEEQLAKSNEPSFTAALDQKRGAQKDAVEKPKQYRKDEKLMLTQAKGVTQEQSAHALGGMDAERGKNFGMVVQHQQSTKDKDHLTRAEVAKNIEDKYAATEKIVNQLLDEADKESNRIFDEGAEAAKNAFENYVDAKMRAYKEDRYSGFWGGLSWLEDKIFGMPDEVNVFYTQGRQMYLDKMDQVITQVANYVTSKLNEAKQAIKDGKKQIDDYVSKLPEDLAEVGKQAASDVQDKFDSLEQSVNDKKDQLIEGLAKKYVDNVKKIDDRISEMKEANAGLIDAAIGFLKKVWQVIKDLTNLFTTILSRLASIIGTILSSPGGFFENLGKAFKQGFNNFKNKFLDYLEQGLMDWLATNLGIAGIELPKEFSPMAIFTLVLQVLGLTKQHIKERAVAILGEKTVAVLETAGGILYRVATEGLGALWEMIQEKLTDLKDVVWEAIKSFIKTKIIEAAIVFLLSLLNPIGAFVKVCMAIYDFLMMLVRFKDRIIELLDSILKAVTDVASGAIDGAANAIEKAFAKSIPVIIGFLAALLHLNDIAAKVRDIITRIRAKVDKAIDFVINKGVSLVKSAGKFLGFGKDKDKDKKDEHSPEKQAKIDAGLIFMHQEQKKYLKNGKINKADADKVAISVKTNHPVFSSFKAKELGKKIQFIYTASDATIAEEIEIIVEGNSYFVCQIEGNKVQITLDDESVKIPSGASPARTIELLTTFTCDKETAHKLYKEIEKSNKITIGALKTLLLQFARPASAGADPVEFLKDKFQRKQGTHAAFSNIPGFERRQAAVNVGIKDIKDENPEQRVTLSEFAQVFYEAEVGDWKSRQIQSRAESNDQTNSIEYIWQKEGAPKIISLGIIEVEKKGNNVIRIIEASSETKKYVKGGKDNKDRLRIMMEKAGWDVKLSE